MQHTIIATAAPQGFAPLRDSLSPWAGRVDLRTMDTAGTAPLSAAVRDAANASHLIFLNGVDAVFPGFIDAIEESLARHPDCAGLELRALPWEAEHHVDPVTLESPTLGPTACLVRRDAFLRAGGLDAAFGPHAMWDELSIRLRSLGGAIFYAPRAVVSAKCEKDDRIEYLTEVNNALLMAFKYGNRVAISAARKAYLNAVRHPRPFPNVRRLLVRQYRDGLSAHGRLKKWRRANPELFQAVQTLPESGLSLRRGVSGLAGPVADGPRFSVVIRTHNRAALLRGALQSVANQTYQNYEIVVVEDGPPTAQKMIEAEFAHLPLTYHATGQKVGRSKAGNLGLSMATGDYLNFLDDDDYFYPDHLEQMAAQTAQHPDADLILGCSVSLFTDGDSAQPDVRATARYTLVRFDRLDVFTMSQMCQIPLLSVAFKKELFQRRGGLHEGMDAHEDWAMWLKYLAVAKRAHPSRIDIPRATSVFLQPASQREADRRMAAYRAYDDALFDDPDIRFDVTLADMRRFYDSMLADIRHVRQLGQLEEFLEREAHRDER